MSSFYYLSIEKPSHKVTGGLVNTNFFDAETCYKFNLVQVSVEEYDMCTVRDKDTYDFYLKLDGGKNKVDILKVEKIDSIKEMASGYISLWATSKIEDGFIWNNKKYGCTTYDQQNYARLYNVFTSMRKSNNATSDTFLIKSKDKTVMYLSTAEFEDFYLAMSNHIDTILAKMWSLKEDVKKASCLNDVNDIKHRSDMEFKS